LHFTQRQIFRSNKINSDSIQGPRGGIENLERGARYGGAERAEPAIPPHIRNRDDDEKGIVIDNTPGGDQQMLIVSEAGVYKNCLHSRKPPSPHFFFLFGEVDCRRFSDLKPGGKSHGSQRIARSPPPTWTEISRIRMVARYQQGILVAWTQTKSVIPDGAVPSC
jgi:hypothetical protein